LGQRFPHCAQTSYKTLSAFLVVGKSKGKALPVQAWTGPEGFRRLKISRKSTHEGGMIVSPTHRPPLPGTLFYQRLSRHQGHSVAGRIMSITPPGIETATFQFIAQCLNQRHHRVPHHDDGTEVISVDDKIAET